MNRQRAAVARGGVVSLCSMMLFDCSTTVTGRKQLTLMPSGELNAMGNQAFQEMKHEKPVEDDPAVTGYVRCIARSLLEEVDAGPQEWEVVVFEDDSANAFALPGGHIGVYTGMLDIAENQDQLAAVLAHEIAHVTQDHSNERVSQTFVAQGGLAIASVALDGQGMTHDLAMAALGLGAQYGVLMPFSRVQESEADTVGLRYMARAGFDPTAAVELWQNMAAKGGASPPEFLSTHPSHETRIEDLRENMDSALATYEKATEHGPAPHCTLGRAPAASATTGSEPLARSVGGGRGTAL